MSAQIRIPGMKRPLKRRELMVAVGAVGVAVVALFATGGLFGGRRDGRDSSVPYGEEDYIYLEGAGGVDDADDYNATLAGILSLLNAGGGGGGGDSTSSTTTTTPVEQQRTTIVEPTAPQPSEPEQYFVDREGNRATIEDIFRQRFERESTPPPSTSRPTSEPLFGDAQGNMVTLEQLMAQRFAAATAPGPGPSIDEGGPYDRVTAMIQEFPTNRELKAPGGGFAMPIVDVREYTPPESYGSPTADAIAPVIAA